MFVAGYVLIILLVLISACLVMHGARQLSQGGVDAGAVEAFGGLLSVIIAAILMISVFSMCPDGTQSFYYRVGESRYSVCVSEQAMMELMRQQK